MKKQGFITLIFLLALFLPNGSHAIVVYKNEMQAWAVPSFSTQNKSDFWTENFSPKKKKPKISPEKKQKLISILKWVLGAIAGILLIYFLQTNILLSVIGAGILLVLNWNKIVPERPTYYSYYPSTNTPPQYPTETDRYIAAEAAEYAMRHSANKWTRRSLIRFFLGLGSLVLGLLLSIASGSPLAVSLGLFGLIFGFIMMIVGTANASKAIRLREPMHRSSKIVIGFVVLLGLLILLGILSGGG